MTTTKKSQNALIGLLSLDTLNSVISSLSFINKFFMHASVNPDIALEKDVLYGLSSSLEQIIEALRYEKHRSDQKVNRASKTPLTRETEHAVQALINPLLKSDEQNPLEIASLLCDELHDLNYSYKRYLSAVKATTDSERTLEGNVYANWLCERQNNVFQGLGVLRDLLRQEEQTAA